MKWKFRADSESGFRIRLSFELTILGFCKTHVHAHFIEFWYIKLCRILVYKIEKTVKILF
jgi:hypothetical protein